MAHIKSPMAALYALVAGSILNVWMAGCSLTTGPHYPQRIVVKFVDNTDIRLDGQRFIHRVPKDARARRLLEVAGLKEPLIASQLTQLNILLQSEFVATIAPLFSDGLLSSRLPPSGASEERGDRRGDLSLYYSIILKNGTPQAEIGKLIGRISSLTIVQTAYEAPVGEDPSMDVPR